MSLAIITPIPLSNAPEVVPQPGAKSASGTSSTPPLVSLGQLVDTFVRDAELRRAALVSGSALGPVTGLARLDERLGNAFAPGLHILHGSPGAGKTAFALQVAAMCGCPALYVTCEMTPVELLRRHTARITGKYLGRFKSGELSGDEVRAAALQAAAAAPHLAILDATQSPALPQHIFTGAEAVRSLCGQSDALGKHFLLVVDSLHSWADGMSEQGNVAEYDRLNEALVSLRILTHRLECPALIITERNRGSMKTGGQSAGAGTRKIEYGAESVLELHVDDDVPRPDTNGANEIEVELRISKNRSGTVGNPISLRFCGALQRYREV